MYKISEKEFNAVIKLDFHKRVEYFKHKVADWESLWLIQDENGFFTDVTIEHKEILMLWPFKEFAMFSLKEDRTYQDRLIEVNIHVFLEEYLPYIKAHSIKLMVFPVVNNGALFNPEDFKIMMEEELAKYGDYDEEYEEEGNSLERRLGKNADELPIVRKKKLEDEK